MKKSLLRISVSNAIYFSGVSFIVLWLAGFLYTTLEKTTGKLSMGATIVIVFCLVLIFFFLAVTNIVLESPGEKGVGFWGGVKGILVFIFTSALLLGVLGLLFLYEV